MYNGYGRYGNIIGAKNKLFRRIFKKYVEYYKNTNKFRLMHIKTFQAHIINFLLKY